MFKGLFVGIDRYESPSIAWLTCAKRDAVALHALFADNLGPGAELLVDDGATRATIEGKFRKLAECDPDDFVVIAFSGHGSESHELVTYDAALSDLATTCVPLETLTEWFSSIPARRLVCILDCCFSGGMGAKVLKVDAVARGLTSTSTLLDRLSGNGRLILSASTATEEAFENQRVGHGLLTQHVLEALQGAEEVRSAGKVGIYPLLNYVTSRVTAAAAAVGKVQHPTLRGQIDGELAWPIFKPSTLYWAAFPERARPDVAADIRSLSAFGFSDEILQAWSGAIRELNPLQIAAINNFGLLDGDHLVVSAPTSSGKTMIGELAALKGCLDRKRAIFLLPLKALVNDKHAEFHRTYGDFGLRTIRATGEMVDDIPALMRGQYDICLMTYEKFAVIVLGSPHVLEQVGTIVVDEVQMIADASRGVNLEFILTLLRMRRRQDVEPQLIALSAVIGSTNGLERWLGGRLLFRTERPVPLDEGVLAATGTFRFLDPDGNEHAAPAHVRPERPRGTSRDVIIPLVRKLVSEGKQVIVFRETRGEARGCALYLAAALGLPPADEALAALPVGDPSIASQALRRALAGGVAFHISDLDRDERLAVEAHFRMPDTKLRVIAATMTLAMGVNTPASAVVIAGLEHPGSEPYSVAEYKNLVGRAGRLGYVERGTSYLIALTPREEYEGWSRYVRGAPEDLESRFLEPGTDPRSLILRVLAAAEQTAGSGLTAEEVIDFLKGSFGAFQRDEQVDADSFARALRDLANHAMVEIQDDGRYRLAELGRLAGQSGVEAESIIRIVDALRPLGGPAITDPTLLATTQLTVELDEVHLPINKKSTIKEPSSWLGELQRQGIPGAVLRALQRGSNRHDATTRAKKAVGCLLLITDRPLSEIESVLTRHGGSFDGIAGPLRSVASRTCDLLPTVARVAELLHAGLDFSARSARLVARLEVGGVPGAAVALAAQAGTRLTRADYLALLRAGLCDIDAVDAAPDERLSACLGGDPTKVAEVRRAARAHRDSTSSVKTPVVPPYQP